MNDVLFTFPIHRPILESFLEDHLSEKGSADEWRYCVNTVTTLSFRTDMPGQTVQTQIRLRSVRVAEGLALLTSVHGVAGSNPAGGEILPEPKRRFIAQSLSYSSFHRLEMTEILLKGHKTVTHPSIQIRLL